LKKLSIATNLNADARCELPNISSFAADGSHTSEAMLNANTRPPDIDYPYG